MLHLADAIFSKYQITTVIWLREVAMVWYGILGLDVPVDTF